jgi:hypothetical protein
LRVIRCARIAGSTSHANSPQLVPGQVITIAAAGAVFWDAINCIAAASSTPATIV